MRVRLKDGREGMLAGDHVMLYGTGGYVPAADCGELDLAPSVRDVVARVDAARTRGFTFAGLRSPAGLLASVPSAARVEAARANGAKGGRPRKVKEPAPAGSTGVAE